MKRLLLDTHTLLWFLSAEENIPSATLGLIEDGANLVCVSMASLWEISIKTAKGNLILPGDFDGVFPRELDANQISVLPVTISHLSRLRNLPMHHRDPFDRLIAAQALVEGLELISKDSVFDLYQVSRHWR